jgi:hypothetical protein
MIELEVIDNLFLGIAPHFFIVMFIFIEDPFKVGNSFSKLDLFPYFSVIHDHSDKIFVIISINNCEGELFGFDNFIYL